MKQADVDGQTRAAGAAPVADGVRGLPAQPCEPAQPCVPGRPSPSTPPLLPAGAATSPTAGWTPPDDRKATMLVHPQVRSDVRALLNRDPSLHGLGYTEFLHAALEAYAAGRWHPRGGTCPLDGSGDG